MKKSVRMFLSGVLALSMFASQAAWAGYVPSNQAITTQQTEQYRSDIGSMLDREDIRTAMEVKGVNADEAKARIAMLSPAQVEELKTQLDTIPAGEGAVGAIIGALLIVFIILLFLDLLGETDAFDFDD